MVEYVLLVTAVALVCIYFFSTQSGSPLSNSLNASLNSMVNQINNIHEQIKF